MAVSRIDVTADSIAGEIGRLTADDLDQLPFGAIQLDDAGKILSYNKAEERLSGRSATDVIGKNFFHDVAPCTRVRRFIGAFQEGVQRRTLNEVFDFTFRFPARTREVRIRMIYSGTTVWIFVTPIDG